jgi:hypothetical protein
MEKVRLRLVVGFAAVTAFAGPQATSSHDRRANAPFVFTPPEGFEPASDAVVKAVGTPTDGIAKVWIVAEVGAATTPNITLTATDKSPRLEEEDLRALAAGMPAVFSPNAGVWSEVRHETRLRADGTRVGILDGALVRGASKKRVLQIIFPTDAGAALVTMTVPEDQLAKWEPKLDASIASATGVALRAPNPPAWLYVAWAVAGGVLAYLTLALFARRKPAPAKTAAANDARRNDGGGDDEKAEPGGT